MPSRWRGAQFVICAKGDSGLQAYYLLEGLEGRALVEPFRKGNRSLAREKRAPAHPAGVPEARFANGVLHTSTGARRERSDRVVRKAYRWISRSSLSSAMPASASPLKCKSVPCPTA